MTAPGFFTSEWAAAVRGALTAGPSEQARAGKLQRYWDSFEKVKGEYASSWALECRDLPGVPSRPGGAAALVVVWADGAVTACQIAAPGTPVDATYTLGMDYQDWKALHEGYDAQRTVMYRKLLLTDGDLLEFFKSIYFFVESLAVIGGVPAEYPEPARPDGVPKSVEELNTEIIKRYLRVFETRDVGELKEIVADDVIAHGAGRGVQGRHWVENSVLAPGLSACRVRVDDLFAARDRVTVSFTMTYTHERTGQDVAMTGTKSYKLRDGKIVEFWGETDVYGFLRQLGLVPGEFPAV